MRAESSSLACSRFDSAMVAGADAGATVPAAPVCG